MAATLITPHDEATGIPLPIAPSCEWLPVNNPNIADAHHGFHPRNDPRLKSVAGCALRNSWLQLTERGLHNEGPLSYHAYFGGPELPVDETEIFSRLILITAGMIPNEVIDMNKGNPVRRSATHAEMAYLRTQSETDGFGYRHIRYRYEPVRDFFREHILKQKIDDQHISENYIDEFFHTNVEERKRFLGHLLIVKAVEAATENVQDKYRYYRRAEMLHPAMPKTPHNLVKFKLGNDKQRGQLIPLVEQTQRRLYGLEFAS